MSSPWFQCFRPNQHASLRLICLPYAGGSAAVFRNWVLSMPASIEIWAVQLPGRGTRWTEPPITRLEILVRELSGPILDLLDRPYAIFGHSFGALSGFELARQLGIQGSLKPVHLFVSACQAPHLPPTDMPIHGLPDQEFLQRLQSFNGTPVEVLEQPELLRLLLPAVRADFEAFEIYQYLPGPALDCPISALGGYQDQRIQRYQLEAWLEYAGARFEVRMFPGDHFFLHSSQALVLRALIQ